MKGKESWKERKHHQRQAEDKRNREKKAKMALEK